MKRGFSIILFFSCLFIFAQEPFGYYKFENTNYLTKDTNALINQGGNNDLLWVPGTSHPNGPSGRYISLSKFMTNSTQISPYTDLGQITASGSPFGPSVSYPIYSNGMSPLINNGSINYSTTGFTFEYLFRNGNYFGTPMLCRWDGVFSIQLYYQSIDIVYKHNDGSNTYTDIHTILLEGMDRKNYNYYVNNDWHHIGISYDNINRTFKLYIDGVCPQDFSFVIPGNNKIGSLGGVDGFLLSKTSLTNPASNSVPYDNFDGDVDELAIFDVLLSDEMLLQHYKDMFPTGFSNCLNSISPPINNIPGFYSSSTNIQPSDVMCCNNSLIFEEQVPFSSLGNGYQSCNSNLSIHRFDTMEFVPSYTDINNLTSTKEQLDLFPYPRYDLNSLIHPIVPIFSQMDRQFKEASDGPFFASGTKQFEINKVLVSKFNYGILLGSLESRLLNLIADSSSYEYKAMMFAKSNPKYLRGLVSNVRNIKDYDSTMQNPNGINKPHCMKKGYLPETDFYFTDQGGTPYLPFFDAFSNQDTSFRAYDPTEPGVSRLMNLDGISSAKWLNDYFNYSLTTPSIDIVSNVSNRNNAIDLIFENGEQFIWTGAQNYLNDNSFAQSFNNQTGAALNLNEFGMKMHLDSILLPFRDALLNNPLINTKLINTRYIRYDIQGNAAYLGPYNISKGILNRIGYSGKIFPNSFYYPQHQYYWYGTSLPGTASWNQIIKARFYELSAGDEFFAPCVSPGVSEGNPNGGVFTMRDYEMMRPSTYLAMLKCLAGIGADHYFAFAYNMNTGCAPNKSEWNTWQYVMPTYAQAVTSRFYDLFKNSTLLPGDINRLFVSNEKRYSFSTGSLSDLVVVREEKNNQGNLKGKYAIFATTQYEIYGDSINAPYTKLVTINLTDSAGNSINKKLSFEVRRQGSVYVYDTKPDLSTAAPQGIKPNVFYQVDKWHERNHPLRWSKDIRMEAEIFDSNRSTALGERMEIWTEVPPSTPQTSNGTPIDGNYTNFTSYLTLYKSQNAFTCYPDTTLSPRLSYLFQPTDVQNQDTLYLMLKMRTKGNPSGLTISLNSSYGLIRNNLISNITSTSWQWYSFDNYINQPVTYENLPLILHTLNLYPQNSDLEIDELVLSENKVLANSLSANNACNQNQVLTLSSSAEKLCQGQSVTFSLSPVTGQCITAPVSYEWDFGNGVTIITNSNQPITHQFNSNPGTYNVTVTINLANGCKLVAIKSILILSSPPVFSLGPDQNICGAGQTITISPNIPYNPQLYSYDWRKISAGVQFSLGGGPTYSFIATGIAYSTQTYGLILKDLITGCKRSDNITYTLIPRPCTNIREIGTFNDTLIDSFNFEIFPNPTKNRCTIKLLNSNDLTFGVKIINQLGQMVLFKENVVIDNNGYDLELPDLIEGIYYIQIVDSNNLSKFKKIIIE